MFNILFLYIYRIGKGRGVIVNTTAYRARTRESVIRSRNSSFQETVFQKCNIVENLRSREVACSTSHRQCSNFESWILNYSIHPSTHSYPGQKKILALFVHIVRLHRPWVKRVIFVRGWMDQSGWKENQDQHPMLRIRKAVSAHLAGQQILHFGFTGGEWYLADDLVGEGGRGALRSMTRNNELRKLQLFVANQTVAHLNAQQTQKSGTMLF